MASAASGATTSAAEQSLRGRLASLLGKELSEDPEALDELDDLPSSEVEELESDVADAATAAPHSRRA